MKDKIKILLATTLAILMLSSCIKKTEESREKSLKNYNKGMQAYSLFKMKSAEKAFKEAIVNDSSNLNARLMLAKIGYFKGEYKAALKYIEEILSQDKNNINGLYWKARIEIMQKPRAKERAKNSLKRVVEVDSHHLPARLLLALLYEAEGENRRALDHYMAVLNEEAYIINARLNLATLYSRMGSMKKAKAELQKAKMISKITGKSAKNIKLIERELEK